MRTLLVATAAFAALMIGAPIGNAHAGVAATHVHPDSYWTSPAYLGGGARKTSANCYLEDSGTVIMNGPCTYQPSGKDGSFFINDGKFEGMAAKDNTGAMIGGYNAIDGGPQKGMFDVLHKVGACWVNDDARICAGKPGETVAPKVDPVRVKCAEQFSSGDYGKTPAALAEFTKRCGPIAE
jgi:hypothetical protein